MRTESKKALANLEQEINEWVDNILPTSYPNWFPPDDEKKVIREAVLGYQVLQPHEYLIMDSPVIQRLKYIHQNALAYLVYPTAMHTRFDHSLGVAEIAKRVGESLGLKEPLIEELRLAALLHDVGHSIFSHISEGLIKTKFEKDFSAIKEEPLFHDRECNEGEILSYLIVKSPRFTALLENVLNHYKKKVNIDRICRLIIGKPRNPNRFAYMGDIIHGPFDADKLDYLVRDCYFTGIRADVDVDRVVISSEILDINKFKDFPNAYLIMSSAGVSNLEQIVLNKILLFPAIYHHHKVRALECMVKAIFETIWDDPDKINSPLLKFEKVSDFFRISEFDFFSLGNAEPELHDQIQKLLNRDLLKRCLIIAPNYIEENPLFEEHDLYTLGDEFPQPLQIVRDFIWDELPQRYRTSFQELWVDLPEPPNIDKDADRCWINIGTDKLLKLRAFFPYGEWLDAYEANKWRGHVFYVSDLELRKAANEAAKTVFRDLYSLEFTPPATGGCKLY